LHASESGGRSRPEAVRGMPERAVPPPGPQRQAVASSTRVDASLPGQAGRFVWRPGPRNGVGGLADDGGRAAIAAQFPSHERVNQTDDAQELEALRRSMQRGRPFGQPEWQKEIARRLGLESAYRPTGRPRKVGRNQNTSPG